MEATLIGSKIPESIEDLRTWVLASDGHERWLGRSYSRDPTGTILHLVPAYAVVGGWQIGKTPQGMTVDRHRMVLPIEWLSSPDEVFVRAVSIVPLKCFDDEDLQGVLGAVQGAEVARLQLRAQRRGLQVVGELPKNMPSLAKARA